VQKLSDLGEICEGCFFFKIREFCPVTGKLKFSFWCLASGSPVRCLDAVKNYDLVQELREPEQDDKQLALKYATSNKRNR
jgi:hypothetical protein